MNNNPSILWAQDRDKLFVTIEIKNFKNKDITFEPKIVSINGESLIILNLISVLI